MKFNTREDLRNQGGSVILFNKVLTNLNFEKSMLVFMLISAIIAGIITPILISNGYSFLNVKEEVINFIAIFFIIFMCGILGSISFLMTFIPTYAEAYR